MSQGLENIAVGFTTQEGFPMAVGGICQAGFGAYWEARFNQLAPLCLSGKDLYTIDYELARALAEIAEDSLLLVGCSVRVQSEFAKEESTGGVLGNPRAAIASAPDACETLPDGFSLFTAAGGPGLAALADGEATQRAALAVKELGPAASGQAIADCLCAEGIDTYLLVLDGTGPEALGCLAAASAGQAKILFLNGCEELLFSDR